MSRLYDSIEPAVIEEGMLLQAVEEQGPKYEAGEIVKKEGIDFDYVLHLRLDFKNILKIDNLWCFIKLTKLQLDNNVIEKIEGLDLLVNLVWLDLSFNNIEEIEGLDNLTKLTDLSLYNNRISTIANMDTLMDLEVLSLGNNDINDLRMRENALKKMQTSLDALVESEIKIQQKEEEQRLMREEYEKDKEAYVESFKDDLLFTSLYADDVEGRKLNEMPGIAEEMVYFKAKILALSNQIFNFGTVEHIKIKDEVDTFWQCVEDAKAENKDLSTKAFNEFIEYKDKTFEDLTFVTEMSEYESKMAEFRKKLEELHDKQLTYEMQLVDQLEDVIKEFEHNLRDLVSAFTEGFQGLLANCRDLESQHHEKMMEVALINVETVHKNEVEDVSEDLRNLFMDKDTLVNAVTTSHEAHLLKIDHEEDKMSQRIKMWVKNLLKRIHDEEEVQRNRDRIIEITNMIDHLREAIDNLEGTVG
ncbi:dynein regulatory complex subunit 3 [Octopus bimaculoides]|uniref:dynein regulatory complex subunit 3 n=1 Tax=Octopus bimaculoides TaxID=37653 RepID=UPI00071C697A|nr:dynein regulatory complex subunit 3 [Octopus bimaculoides]|eukprot:XP_014770374.1 PREDICTED: leucine-rich repeat-containing protein 48-like [Octopus bimaculoides]